MTRVVAASVAAMSLVTVSFACSKREPKTHLIAIDGRPSAIAVAGGSIWVADDEHHSVSEIDPETAEVVGEPIKVHRNPVAMTGDARSLWVAHASGWIDRIDVRRHRVAQRIDGGGSYTGIALTDGLVWVTDVERGLFGVDPSDTSSFRFVPLDQGAVRVIALDGRLWVTGRENTVTRVDAHSPKDQKTYKVGSGPIGLAAVGHAIWTANSDDGTVQLVGTDRTVKTGRGPIALASASGVVWVINDEDQTLVRIGHNEGRIDETVALDVHPRGIVARDGVIWVAGTNPPPNSGGVVRVLP